MASAFTSWRTLRCRTRRADRKDASSPSAVSLPIGSTLERHIGPERPRPRRGVVGSCNRSSRVSGATANVVIAGLYAPGCRAIGGIEPADLALVASHRWTMGPPNTTRCRGGRLSVVAGRSTRDGSAVAAIDGGLTLCRVFWIRRCRTTHGQQADVVVMGAGIRRRVRGHRSAWPAGLRSFLRSA